MKRAEITCDSLLCFEDGRQVPFSEAQREDWVLFQKNQSNRHSQTLSEYYSYHLEEYIALLNELEEKEKKRHADVSQSKGDGSIPA